MVDGLDVRAVEETTVTARPWLDRARRGWTTPARADRVRAVSPKRAAQMRERGKLVRRSEPQVCERCHLEPAVDHHELTRRSQSSTSAVDLDEMIPIGRACHDWIGLNPELAVATGWAKWSHPDRVAPRKVTWRPPGKILSDTMSETPRAVRKVSFRMTAAGGDLVDGVVAELGVKPSTAIRAALSVGFAHRDEIVRYITTHRKAAP